MHIRREDIVQAIEDLRTAKNEYEMSKSDILKIITEVNTNNSIGGAVSIELLKSLEKAQPTLDATSRRFDDTVQMMKNELNRYDNVTEETQALFNQNTLN